MNAPDYVISGAKSRIAGAVDQRRRALEAVRRGRPLDAEEDPDRKVRRIQRIAQLDPDQAMGIATYSDTALKLLPGPRRRMAERIQGKTVDFVGTAFLDLARVAANAVGRVVYRNLQPQGSGFMISDRLFLTNNHVIDSTQTAGNCLVEFNYELDANGHPNR